MSTAAVAERQTRPIYDALETGSTKAAILACNKLLKKQPQNVLVKALKALGLVRAGKAEESLALSEEVLAAKSTDDRVLSAMMHVLRALGRHNDMVTMFDAAFKQQPTNEDLGAQTFFANVRTGNWKSAQQIATRMHKQFKENRYLYWSVMSAVLQANDPTTPPNTRPILYKLAHRLLPPPSHETTADQLYLHLAILRDLQLHDEARKLLEGDTIERLCKSSLSLDEIRREIARASGLWKEEGERAEKRILELRDRNWLEFLSVLDATFAYVSTSNTSPDEAARTACKEHVDKTRALFEQLAEEDGTKDRSALLALVELEHRACLHGVSSEPPQMVPLLEKYFDRFSVKACCFEDLKPFVILEGEELSRWTAFLGSIPFSVATAPDLQRSINATKLLRYNLSASSFTTDLEISRAQTYATQYIAALPLGKNLPETELQPADDLALLAAQAFTGVWDATGDEGYLYNAVSLLEFALVRSKQAYTIRLLLVRLYRLLGAASSALEHYRLLNLKQMQHDTLSHLLLSRAATYSLASTGDLTLAQECIESSQIYLSNSQDTADFVVRAFTSEKYSMVPDFIAFEDRLDNSLQRDLIKVEHVRMRMTHEPIVSDMIDMELVELKFIFDRVHHDNRDVGILPNYQPRTQPSFDEQTLLFKKDAGLGWLITFLKVYVRALQQASDLSDTVEEKLLICDRPKQGHIPDTPLSERLAMRNEEELKELTAEELLFYDFVTALAEWLGPYHDYMRPSPAAVLAEAAKQTELRTGHPPKGLQQVGSNGSATSNGHAKKDEEAPAIQESPEILIRFFDDMLSKFHLVKEAQLPSAVLHIVTLIQEALIFLTIESLRYKSAALVKVHKLGAIVQSLKPIKIKAIAVLREAASELVNLSEKEGTSDRRRAFVDACKPLLETSEQIEHDFVLNVAKKVTDARKKVLEGVGKGALRVSTVHE